MDLKTKYLGLELKNPIIVGASNLVTDIKMLQSIEEAGAAAIVYKSLFEEQINLEQLQMEEDMGEYANRNPEMINIFPQDIYEASPNEFLMHFKEARKAVSVPLIASLNAVFDDTWYEWAKKLEEAGADALELNFYNNPREFDMQGIAILHEELDIIKGVKNTVKIPVSVKLSSFYTNPLYVFKEMDKTGVDGLVLFNRLFQPDINIDSEKMAFSYNLSNEQDNRLPLRYAGMLYGQLNCDVCANTGIFNAGDVIKMILAGADAVQIVSTIYKNGPQQIGKILEDMEMWMADKKYETLDAFRGNLSMKNVKDPFAYRRAQYVDILMRSAEIFKQYPII